MKPQLTAADLDADWMPFTANRSFKKNSCIITRASGASGAYFEDAQGRRIFDGAWLRVFRASSPVRCGARDTRSSGKRRAWRNWRPHFENAGHNLRGLQYVSDIRSYGLAAGLTIEALPSEPARCPYEIAMHCWDHGFYVRYGKGTIDPLIEALQAASVDECDIQPQVKSGRVNAVHAKAQSYLSWPSFAFFA